MENKILRFVEFKDIESWSTYAILGSKFDYSNQFELAKIRHFLKRNKTQVSIKDEILYKRPTIKINGQGIFLRDEKQGKDIGTKNQFRIREGQFLLSKIDARNGAFGVVPKELDNGIITGNFWTFDVDYEKINPYFLTLVTKTKKFQNLSQSASVGTTNRNYLQEEEFLNFQIPLPNLDEQEAIVSAYQSKIEEAQRLENEAQELENEIENYLFEELGIEQMQEKKGKVKGLQLVEFQDLQFWGVDKIITNNRYTTKRYKSYSIGNVPNLIIENFRGKSPKYKLDSEKYILNQKCNRWNSLDLSFVKSVEENWYNTIEKKIFTKEGDILINSTGEGTIGRSTYIDSEHTGLIYDSHLLLLRLNQEILNPKLFVEVFNSSYGQYQIELIKSAQATKQTELGVNNLQRIIIPIVDDMNKQNEIATTIATMKQTQKQKTETATSLRAEALAEFEQVIFN
ncbi:restriction endonuclease subunit S [Capnocytophaga cynodegmi]|uniref:Type I restriction modification DNA specificity domain-containing protein n=1 Tax=Capnocytophaga cynodegmi TaxID=28189 RepID=A0A0B7H9T8_9FLAO|nr:restriction endonuclease subunit S [Capnocytophaga cynodegmi]CEN34692.1 conserved hypothetical protein [Capnocytophaga cynodegmi]